MAQKNASGAPTLPPPNRPSVYDIVANTSRNLNKLFRLSLDMQKAVKDQSKSIEAIKKELSELKSFAKAQERRDYNTIFKKAGYEVSITVRCIHNYYVTLIFITKESIERKIGNYVLCILNQTAK